MESISKQKQGFTLIELLVVIAVMGILSLIITSNYNLAKHRAKVGRALADMRTIKFALESYRLDEGALPPDVDAFIPFILTDPLSKPVPYLTNNRDMRDPLNDFEPNPKQWRFQTYRYVNIKGHIEGVKALNSNRNPNDWLPISMSTWHEAHQKYGDYLITSTHIQYKENFKRDEAGRSKAVAKWNEFVWNKNDSRPEFMKLKKVPYLSAKRNGPGQ